MIAQRNRLVALGRMQAIEELSIISYRLETGKVEQVTHYFQQCGRSRSGIERRTDAV